MGSTGTVGKLTLEVVKNLKDFEVVGLITYRNVDALLEQYKFFRPGFLCVIDKKAFEKIKDIDANVYAGKEGVLSAIDEHDFDIVVNALSGTVSVEPTLKAIKKKKRIAISNKEIIVAYGEIIMREAQKENVEIIPVDSEHSAIFQCLYGRKKEDVKKVILTASGGPFFREGLREDITPEEALSHPVWKMGKKITIDSATLMNKALEIIEANRLFSLPHNKIKVLIHPQAVIHSFVEFIDNSVLAQLSYPDMRLPIQYALTHPKREISLAKSLDFSKIKNLEFYEPDTDKFPALNLAYYALKEGGTMPAVLNTADEICVRAFLQRKIKITDITKIVEKIMQKHKTVKNPGLEDIKEAEKWTEIETKKEIEKCS